MLSFQVVINAPYMTYDEYARFSGLTIRTIREWANEGKLIVKAKTKNRETPMVNVIAMTEMATREAMTRVS
ncbi:hypothetical protein L4D76_24510 [Photobacterium sagamiensis]|uniref:hypothetical protein n=1 Tax=Photobacterium sagamiensis TaxID=2910241 RepID=UPI003D0FCB94